jgi:integrase
MPALERYGCHFVASDTRFHGRWSEQPWVRPGQRSLAGSAPLPASTGTPKRKASSRSRRRCMSAGHDLTTSPAPPVWTATRSAPCSLSRVSARDHALVSLLALNGLRVSEAIGADIEALGLERGHRTLTVLRTGGKIVIAPLAPRTARAVDLAVGERDDGPVLTTSSGCRLDRHAAARIVRRIARRAGIAKRVRPQTLRHAFITAALDAGVPLRDVQAAASHADPRTTMRYDRARVSLDRHTTYIVATFIAAPPADAPG